MVLSLPQSYIVKPFATILKDLPQPCWHWLTGVHLIPLQEVHFKVIQTVHLILIYPVHLKVIWAVHLKCCNQTVTHPSQDGVGIAGPQIGLNRRVVAVQRFDKEGEPFEVYPNVRIVWASDSLAAGPEGCLSVPDRRGEVLRSQEIIIEYADITGIEHSLQQNRLKSNRHAKPVPMVRDTVSGFTAVIFQHEIDHLDGVLYIDRL